MLRPARWLLPLLAIALLQVGCEDSKDIEELLDATGIDIGPHDIGPGPYDVGPFDLGVREDASVAPDAEPAVDAQPGDAGVHPDAACLDDDQDGVCNDVDRCASGDDRVDTDTDGVPDACDVCPSDASNDADGDGVCGAVDVCPGGDDRVDGDGDGVPDACDLCPLDNPDDDDLDGVCNSADVCPGSDDAIDTDGDGVPDGCDACPVDNPDDPDGDGVCTVADICPRGDDAIDGDLDGVPDACDNCPLVENADQANRDGVAAYSIPFAPLPVVGGSTLALSDDELSAPVPIGFPFRFFGNTYTEVVVSSNGFLTFTATAGASGCCSGGPIPNTYEPNNLIALAWTDLYPPAGGSITYATIGTAPARIFEVTFDQINWCCGVSTTTTTVQALLFEGTDQIEIHTTGQPGGHTYTRGVENAAGTYAAFIRDERNRDYQLLVDGVGFTTSTTADDLGDVCSGATDVQQAGSGGSGGSGGNPT